MQKKFSVALEQRVEIESLISEFKRQLRRGDMIDIDPYEVCTALRRIVRPGVMGSSKNTSEILRLVSEREPLVIAACDGSQTFVDEGGIFNHVNASIHLEGARFGVSTPETYVEIYETKIHATPAEIFISAADDLNKVCLTEHQMVIFCKKYYTRLHLRSHSYPTLFLRKKGAAFFVVRVFWSPSGNLSVREDRFRHGGRISPVGVHVVVPKIAER